MKRLVGLLSIVLCCVFFFGVSPADVAAQDDADTGQILIDGRVAQSAENIVDVTVLSAQNVELDGMPFTVYKASVDNHVVGDAPDVIYIETPGGTRSDGSWVVWSHTPTFEAGDTLQAALLPVDDGHQGAMAVATGEPAPVFSLVEGDRSVEPLGESDWVSFGATPPYVLSGFEVPSFPRDFRINPANVSGLSNAQTIAAARRGFDMWENDPGSDIDFTYRGTTTLSGLGSDQTAVVSWQGPNSANGLGTSLARAYISFSSVSGYEFDIILNRNYSWSNGVSGLKFDIGSVVGHEVGHGLGLSHNLSGQPIQPASSELMHWVVPNATAKPLGNGDRAGVALLYPGSAPVADPTITGETFTEADCAGLTFTVRLADGENGTNGPDVILGTPGPDEIWGRDGDDIICGGGGDDRIIGGDGNDRISGGSGSDYLDGRNDNDIVSGDRGNDFVYGGRGNDVLLGGANDDKVVGGDGDDIHFGEGGVDRIYGRRGEDQVDGGSGNDAIFGGRDDDILLGGANDDKILGDAGDDELYGGAGADLLYGRDDNDTLRGGNGNDRVDGDDGDDILYGDSGTDRVIGDRGFDSCDDQSADTLRECENTF